MLVWEMSNYHEFESVYACLANVKFFLINIGDWKTTCNFIKNEFSLKNHFEDNLRFYRFSCLPGKCQTNRDFGEKHFIWISKFYSSTIWESLKN
jgi:hypothetical protein